MANYSSPYHSSNSTRSPPVPPKHTDTGNFRVVSSSFETPYDIAKKRQSQFMTPQFEHQQHQLDLDDIIDYVPLTTTGKASSDYKVKLVVVGDGGCGKTCLLISYARGEFPEMYVPTIFENYISQVRGSHGKIVELSLWDTAGQEEYDRLRPLSYPDTNVVIICYSVNNKISLQNVREKWAPEVKMFCEDVPFILVGTKLDLLDNSSEEVGFEEAEALAKEIGAVKHLRCSAKTTKNIRKVFNTALAISQNDIEQPPQFRFGFRRMKDNLRQTFKSRDYDNQIYNEYNSKGNSTTPSSGSRGKRKGLKSKSQRCVIL